MPVTTTDPGAVDRGPAWEPHHLVFEFQHCSAARAPRAWDREPKVSSNTNNKGRKVWKRYGLRQKESNGASDDNQNGQLGTENSPRVVKRLCLVQPPVAQVPSYASKPSQYLATLQDRGLSTPRRKISKRKSLWTDDSSRTLSKRTVDVSGANGLMEQDAEEAQYQLSPQIEPVQADLHSDDWVVETQTETPPTIITEKDDSEGDNESTDNEETEGSLKDGSTMDELTSALEEPSPERLSAALQEHLQAEGHGSLESTEAVMGPDYCAIPLEEHRCIQPEEGQHLSEGDPAKIAMNDESTGKTADVISPKIRRRSHRISKQTEDFGLSPRQEEIPSPSRGRDVPREDVLSPTGHSTRRDNAADEISSKSATADDDTIAKYNPQALNASSEEAPHLYVQANELLTIAAAVDNLDASMSADVSLDRTNNTEKSEMSPNNQGKTIANRTRSGARFSDETSMLKDFLNRAQASKAARSTAFIPAPENVVTPRRSPRKVLGHLDKNSPSPTKSRNPAHRPGTPPGKSMGGLLECEDAEDTCSEPVLHRRSTRNCPSAKKPPSAPSFIPVRRPDGADPVILQKSVAQELAIVTRTNTRRNKGSAKVPALMLKRLAGKVTEDMPADERPTRSTKSVEWDRRLVYYQESIDSPKGQEKEREVKADARPKARRLKGPGSINGTLASKSVRNKISANGSPASKCRGKIKV